MAGRPSGPEVRGWAAELERVADRIGRHFVRTEPVWSNNRTDVKNRCFSAISRSSAAGFSWSLIRAIGLTK